MLYLFAAIVALVIIVVVALVLGLAYYTNQPDETTYNMDDLVGVYYYMELMDSVGVLDYIVLRADSSYTHVVVDGTSTIVDDGTWKAGRTDMHSFSIPYVDFFYLYNWKWDRRELRLFEGDFDLSDSTMGSYYDYHEEWPVSWTWERIVFGDWLCVVCGMPYFYRVSDRAMANSLGIIARDEDFPPIEDCEPGEERYNWSH